MTKQGSDELPKAGGKGTVAEDPPLRPDLKAALEALYVPRQITDGDLEKFRRRFEEMRHEAELRRFARLGTPRDAKSYNYSRAVNRRMKFYETRYDRIFGIVVGLAGLVAGGSAFFAPQFFRRERLLSAAVFLGGGSLTALALQSGRAGYLEQKSLNQIDDIGASLSTTIIRGHHQVHAAEASLLRAARENQSERVLLIDLWLRQRRSVQTHEFDRVQEEALRYANETSGELVAAVAATKPNIDQCAELMRHRLGKAKQVFFFHNPIQLDAVLSEEEAILSLPRKGTDRDFALHFRSPAIVRELWNIFEGQLMEERSDVDSVSVRDEADVERVHHRMCTGRVE